MFEETPFGRKAVRTVVAKVRLAAGAKDIRAAQRGLTSPEELYVPPVKKVTAIRKSGKKKGEPYEAYEYLPSGDAGIQKWVG